MASFAEAFYLIWNTCKQEWEGRGPTLNFIVDFLNELSQYSCLQLRDLLLCFGVAIAFTLLRLMVTFNLFQPIARSFNMNSKGQRNFPESSFKLIAYFTFYMFECFLLFSKYPQFLTDLTSCWQGWNVCLEIPSDIYGIYIAEIGFYIHGIYATIFLDIWRDDSILMLVHHFLTISLLIFSLAIRYHRIGLVVLFLHDIADICLEMTKVTKCFQKDQEKSNVLLNYVIMFGFISFASVWIYCRIIWYPMIILYSTGHVARSILPDAPFYFFFNGMLWLLFIMNIFWCYYIVVLVYNIVGGKSKVIDDIRETNNINGFVKDGNNSSNDGCIANVSGKARSLTNGDERMLTAEQLAHKRK